MPRLAYFQQAGDFNFLKKKALVMSTARETIDRKKKPYTLFVLKRWPL
jgi:hypothetical protein